MYDNAGWIVYNPPTAKNIVNIINCSSTLPISGSGCGGILGGGGLANISNCYSTGEISGPYAGGIVGNWFSGTTTDLCTIQNCYSTGDITGEKSGGIAGAQIGGEYYSSSDPVTTNIQIINCYSLGNIYTDTTSPPPSINDNTSAGGICGGSFGPQYSTNLTITNCYSNGTFSAGNGIFAISLSAPISPYPVPESCYTSNGNWSNSLASIQLTGTPIPPSLIGIVWTSDGTSPYTLTSNSIPVVCFLEGSNILTIVNDKELYQKIENIKCDTLIKTYLHGYKKVTHIGKTTIYNSKDPINNLYKLSKDKYKELTKDLYITGAHSILINKLTKKQEESTIKILGEIYITDDKYRLMACLDNRAEMLICGRDIPYIIWHLVLENDFIYENYGIYANNLLVESCSQWSFEDSNLKKIRDD